MKKFFLGVFLLLIFTIPSVSKASNFVDTPYFVTDPSHDLYRALHVRFHGNHTISVSLEGSNCNYTLASNISTSTTDLHEIQIPRDIKLSDCSDVKFKNEAGVERSFSLSQLDKYDEAVFLDPLSQEELSSIERDIQNTDISSLVKNVRITNSNDGYDINFDIDFGNTWNSFSRKNVLVDLYGDHGIDVDPKITQKEFIYRNGVKHVHFHLPYSGRVNEYSNENTQVPSHTVEVSLNKDNNTFTIKQIFNDGSVQEKSIEGISLRANIDRPDLNESPYILFKTLRFTDSMFMINPLRDINLAEVLKNVLVEEKDSAYHLSLDVDFSTSSEISDGDTIKLVLSNSNGNVGIDSVNLDSRLRQSFTYNGGNKHISFHPLEKHVRYDVPNSDEYTSVDISFDDQQKAFSYKEKNLDNDLVETVLDSFLVVVNSSSGEFSKRVLLRSLDVRFLRDSQSEEDSSPNVIFEVENASFARIKRGNTYWGLHIDPPQGGKVHRQKDETIYFVLKEDNGNKRQTLCKFDGGSTEFAGPSFPGCFVEDSSKLFNVDGLRYGIVDIIEYGKDYSVYFSSDLGGDTPISQVKSIGKAIPKGNIVIDPNINVEVKEKDGGHYFHIEGDVIRARPVNLPQDAKLYLTLIDANQNSSPLSAIDYKKGTHFSVDSKVLDPGTYFLVVRSKLDSSNNSESGLNAVIDLQTIPLQKQIPGNSTNTQSGNGSHTISGGVGGGEPYSDYNGKSLVPLDCGYNLGKGGRMCVLNDFIRMIRRIISYIFIIMIPIAAIVFAYAGYQLLFSGGNTQKRDAAKKAATNLLIGIAVFILAWVIVNLIVSTLGLKPDFNIFFGS